MKFLFLGAHPDDIELGAGGTIAKARRLQIECESLILSDCRQNLIGESVTQDQLIKETISAHKVLGVSENSISFFDFPVRNFNSFRQDILQVLIEKSKNMIWDKIFIPNSTDIHQDHQVLSVEARRAFKTQSLLGYELPWNNIESKINIFNSLSIEDVTLKIQALSEFKSQQNREYMKPDAIRSILGFRGVQIKEEYCEGFEAIRGRL